MEDQRGVLGVRDRTCTCVYYVKNDHVNVDLQV